MECLICYKVTSNHFIPSYTNTHLSTTIYKLLELSTAIISDNFNNSKSLSLHLCPECHEKLDRVELMLGQLDELQLKLSEIRNQITADLIKSEELSQSDGHQLEERSKIVQELCSTIGKRDCPRGVPVQEKVIKGVNDVNVKIDVDKNSGFYDENDEIDHFFDNSLFAPHTNDDAAESNTPLKLKSSLTSSIPRKEVKIILERFQCPNGDAVSFNINEEPIASFIRRDQENIIKTQKCRNKSLTTTPKLKKRRKKGTGGYWRPPKKQQKRKTQADYKINFQDQVKFCSICNVHFNRPVKYRDHLLKHTGELPFSCDRCEKRFRNNYLLKAHLRTHGIGEGVIQCQICSIYLISQKRADDHYKITHGGLRPYKCLEPGCTRIYSSEAALVDHNLSQHLGQKFHCTYPQCQKSCNSNGMLKTHIKKIHLKDFKYSCKEPGCDKSFHVPSELRRHNEEFHLMIKNFKCDKCPKAYYSQNKFDRHYQVNHSKDYLPFICSICSKGFFRKQNLKRHLKLHLGIRDEICQYCGEGYSSNESLKMHISRKHLGNERYLVADTTKRRKVGRKFRVPKLSNLQSENLADFL